MKEIKGVNLSRAVESAGKAFAASAERRLSDYLRGLKVQGHNLRMKALRLTGEAEQAAKAADAVDEQVRRIESGDWSAVEPLELTEK